MDEIVIIKVLIKDHESIKEKAMSVSGLKFCLAQT